MNDIDWGPIVEIAPLFLELDGFDRQERGYKLELAASVVELAEVIRAGDEPWDQLKQTLRHKENNLISWQLADRFLKWADENHKAASDSLSAVFDSEAAPLDALGRFLELLPGDEFSGKGTRLSLASFFLMGVDAENFPIYRSQAVKHARQLAGWESSASTEVEEYEDAVEMFASFREAADSAGVPVRDPLEAQGLLYAASRWEISDDWSGELTRRVRSLRRDMGLGGTLSFPKAIADFDRSEISDRVASAVEQRNAFVNEFSVASWPDLAIERYAIGTGEKADASYKLEFATKDCGSIGGGSANKFLIYFNQTLQDYKFEPKYENASSAWESIRSGVAEMLALCAEGDFSAVDEIDALWAAPSVRCKLAWMYFPDLLPIYSDKHLDFWLSIFDIEASNQDRVAKNRNLFEALVAMPEFEGWQTLEIMHFLYWWTDPVPSKTILKVAPGREASLWDDCLSNGYIRVGWDELDDLSVYEKQEELKAQFGRAYPEDTKSSVTSTVRDLWAFRNLEPGDLVLANRGTKAVVGIGRVTDPYFFDRELPDHCHTVGVDWFDTAERSVEFGSAWMRTIVSVKSDDYHRIVRGAAQHSNGRTASMPTIPGLHREAEKLLERSGQIIFYGPPGTGKTYAARRHAAWLLSGGSRNPEAALVFGESSQLVEAETEFLRATESDARPSWVVVANPSYWKFDELFEKGSEEYDYGRLQRNYDEAQSGDEVFGYEATPVKKFVARARVSRSLYTTSAGKQHIEIEPVDRPGKHVTWDMLKEDPVLSASEPMTSRMQGTLFKLQPAEAARLRSLAEFEGEHDAESGVAQLTRVTFHPTYAYEDFIEGLSLIHI